METLNRGNKNLQTVKGLTIVLTPVLAMFYLFSVTVVKAEGGPKRLPAVEEKISRK